MVEGGALGTTVLFESPHITLIQNTHKPLAQGRKGGSFFENRESKRGEIMRPLTKHEVDLISGGMEDGDGDTITVTGDPSDSSSTWSSTSSDSTSTSSSSDGGQDGDDGDSEPLTESEQVEVVAQQAQQLIAAKAVDGNEHGYFIIRDANGQIKLGTYHEGTPNEIKFGGDDTLSLSETGASSWENVLGFVHNHPHTEDSPYIPGDPNEWNKTPSEGDWDILDGVNSVNGDEDFKLYIMDSDGDLRAYDAGSSRDRNDETDVIEP